MRNEMNKKSYKSYIADINLVRNIKLVMEMIIFVDNVLLEIRSFSLFQQ